MRFDLATSERYLQRLGGVQGWLDDFSARVLLELARFQTAQGMRGGVAEIGVHHGKLFLLLYLATQEGEPALAIDVFGLQHLNVDKSGRGDKAVFLRHVDRLAGTREGLTLIEDSSLNLKAEDLVRAHGRVRLFSIDGSHTAEATANDLALAEASLTEEGVVVVDDCFNPSWPEVSWALAEYLLRESALVPFAITPGKVLLCRPPSKARYRAMLHERFARRVDKQARLYGHAVLVVGIRPWTLKRAAGATPLGGWLKRRLRPAH